MPSLPKLPLTRFKVLDLTRARAGPTAVRQLADMGAEVIKIEDPGTNDGRSVTAGDRHGFDFQNLHRNKRSLTLNLKAEEGKKIFFELVKDADVVIENYRPGVKTRLGIDYEACKAVNPRIVYGSISGFGQDGPYANRPGVDQIAQGMGGLMSVTGLPGQGPVRVGVPIADLTAGMYLAIGVLTALLEREVSGEGQWVHTSLLEAQLAMLDFQLTRWTMGGQVPPQAGNNHPTGVPTGVFETADGHINIAAAGDVMFERMAKCLGAPEMLEDARFKTNKSRQQHRDELNEAIAGYTRQNTSAFWVDAMNEAGVPCGPIYSVDQACADPQVQHLGFVVPVEHPRLGSIDIARHATNLSRTPHRMRNATPEQGECTEDILSGLGYSADQIVELRAKRAI
ncbi:MAG TPA: CaiB/BaiF CoA-transferase family protein [Alphaproteobacteria bacterium]|nr:CaiB/BaiF CoA-transferase family protein [Alphaproteobacteria bacterium]